jgi:hypothetical protein
VSGIVDFEWTHPRRCRQPGPGGVC